nr:hypothetical protein [Allomuricauda sp.]
MKLRHYIWFLGLGVIGCAKSVDAPQEKTTDTVKLISMATEFSAGESITLLFEEKAEDQLLLVQNGWGTFALKPDSANTALSFTLPQSISQKSGLVHWTLLHQKNKVNEGDISILPSKMVSDTMESYIGPTSIFANNQDQAMIVSLPQDEFGNPLPEETIIQLTEKFKDFQKSKSVPIHDMITHSYVGGVRVVGEIFLGTSLENQVSKEFTVSVLPTKSADFNITAVRQHHFADGNQTVSFTTSTIKDQNGNIIADGTLVNFVIGDSSGNRYQTYGLTLHGTAVGKMLHPEEPTEWNIKAHISGVSQSNSLKLIFDAAVLDYAIQISKDGKTITIGPILSYMKQWVPDGMGIHLEVQSPEGRSLVRNNTTSRKGMGKFELPEGINANQNIVRITVAGIQKTINGE